MTYAISANGLALIREYEGFRAEPAQLPDGNWVVGHGHVRIGEAGPAVTENEAGDLLALDLAPVERLVNAAVTTALTQSQFDALVSFAFSIGHEQFERSQVARRVNTGDFVSAACAMDAWRKSDVSGELEIVDALVRRRAAEKALFLKDLPHDAAPSVFMRAKLDYAASVLGAPLKYAAAPAVGSIPVVQMKQQDNVVLTEVLQSEPATETLLLTQPIANDVDDADTIHTAHAKPVARTMDDIRAATRLAYETQQPANDRRPRFTLFQGKAEQPKLEIDRRLRSMRKRACRLPLAELRFRRLVRKRRPLRAARVWPRAGRPRRLTPFLRQHGRDRDRRGRGGDDAGRAGHASGHRGPAPSADAPRLI